MQQLLFCAYLSATLWHLTMWLTRLHTHGNAQKLRVHSQSMTKLQLGQVFSCWSNVSRPRVDQHVSQLTNFGQRVTLTLPKVWLTYDQDMTMTLVKSSSKSMPSNDHNVTKIWPRILGLSYDCVFSLDLLTMFLSKRHQQLSMTFPAYLCKHNFLDIHMSVTFHKKCNNILWKVALKSLK